VESGIAGLAPGPGAKPQLPEPFTIEKLVPMMDDAGVDRAVIVPPSWPGDRNDYALEAAKRYPSRFAVMGASRSRIRNRALLPKWKEQPECSASASFSTMMSRFLADGRDGRLALAAAEKAGKYRLCFLRRAGCRCSPASRSATRSSPPHCRPLRPNGGYGEGQLDPGRRRSGGRAR
jgi:hypothetical protein